MKKTLDIVKRYYLGREFTKEKLVDILKEEINLDKYIEDWLGKGGVHDDSSINRVFVLKLKQFFLNQRFFTAVFLGQIYFFILFNVSFSLFLIELIWSCPLSNICLTS